MFFVTNIFLVDISAIVTHALFWVIRSYDSLVMRACRFVEVFGTTGKKHIG